MPKQLLKINQFHGGLNTSSNPRDIADNELSDAVDIMVNEPGVVKMMPTAAVHSADTALGSNTPTITLGEGTGLYSFSHDRKLDALKLEFEGLHGLTEGQWIGNHSDFTEKSSGFYVASVGIIYDSKPDDDLKKVIVSKHQTGGASSEPGPWYNGDSVYVGSSAEDAEAILLEEYDGANKLASQPTIETPQDGENYLALTDSANANVWIWDETGRRWYNRISLGSISDCVASFYSADGAIRVADANHGFQVGVNLDTSNKPQWYGYIDRRHFGDGVNGNDQITIDNIDINNGYPYSKWWTGAAKLESFPMRVENASNPAGVGLPTAQHTPIVMYFDVNKRGSVSTGTTSPHYSNTKTSGIKIQGTDKFARLRGRFYATDDRIVSTGTADIDIENFCEIGDEINIHTDLAGTDNEDIATVVKTVIGEDGADDELWLDTAMSNQSDQDINLTNLNRCEWWDSTLRFLQFGMSTLYDEKQESEINLCEDIVNLAAPGNVSEARLLDYENPTFGVKCHCTTTNKFLSAYPRVSGFNIYVRRSGANGGAGDFYKLMEISVTKGLRMVEISDTFSMWEDNFLTDDSAYVTPKAEFGQLIASGGTNTFPSSQTYIASAGVDRTDAYTSVEGWKTAIIANRIAYLGNIKQNGRVYGDRMIKSLPNQFDKFPDYRVIDVTIEDGDSIVKLNEYADRILQFKKTKMHLINISQEVEFLEETFTHKGISTPAASCETDYGIAWANEHGVYLYDGETVKNLFERKGVKLISHSQWRNFLVKPYAPSIGYMPLKRQIIINASIQNIEGGSNCYLYDIITESWTTGVDRFSSVQGLYPIRTQLLPTAGVGFTTGQGDWTQGTTITLSAYPYQGYSFSKWTDVDGVELTTYYQYEHVVEQTDEHATVIFIAVFTEDDPWGWKHLPEHNINETAGDGDGNEIPFHFAGTWFNSSDAEGPRLYKGGYYDSTESGQTVVDAADENLAHHNWLFSPNQYYDEPTDRTYMLAAIDPQLTGADGWENCIGYYDHGAHEMSDFYGTGTAVTGALDQHALGAFIISKDSAGNRYINVINPKATGTGYQGHNGVCIIMRSHLAISDSTQDEVHLERWNYICSMGIPKSQHGNGFVGDPGGGAEIYHLDYPHIYNCDANGDDAASVLVLCSGFTETRSSSGYATHANRNCIMAYRSIDAGLTWCDFGTQFDQQDLPYGMEFIGSDTTGIWGCQENVANDSGPQNCAGYKVLDLWDGNDSNNNYPKMYFTLLHGKGKIGLAVSSGMDGDSGYGKSLKDLLYIQTYNGYTWMNVKGQNSFVKNVLTGSGNAGEGGGVFNEDFRWITTLETGIKENLMWICSGRNSYYNGQYDSNAFAATYDGISIPHQTQDLRSSTSWKTASQGAHNDFGQTVGNFNSGPYPDDDDDRSHGLKTVICFWGMHLYWQGNDNVLLHVILNDMWNGNTGNSVNFGDAYDRADVALVYFNFTANGGIGRWDYRNDGRSMWGQRFNKSETTNSYLKASGPWAQGMFHQQYTINKHDVWVMMRQAGHTLTLDSDPDISVGKFVGNASDFGALGTTVSLVVHRISGTSLRVIKGKVGYTGSADIDWAATNNLYVSENFKDSNAAPTGVAVSSVVQHNGVGRGKWILRWTTTDFFREDFNNTTIIPNEDDPDNAIFFDMADDGFSGGLSMTCPMIAYNNQELGLSGAKEMIITDWIKDMAPSGTQYSKMVARVFVREDLEPE